MYNIFFYNTHIAFMIVNLIIMNRMVQMDLDIIIERYFFYKIPRSMGRSLGKRAHKSNQSDK